MNPTITCQNMAPFAKEVWGATGALVDGEPLICGGFFDGYSDECYMITKSSTSLANKMNSKRYGAASVVVNINKLWVLGGSDGSSYLSSTEYIQIGIGSSTGPELPFAVSYHAMVALNPSTFIIIGGYADGYVSGYSSKTFYYEHWITGPDMDQARAWHAAGLGIDTASSDQYIAVTGGSGYSGYLDSVEILFPGESEWQTGKQWSHKKGQIGPCCGLFVWPLLCGPVGAFKFKAL